MSSSQSKDITSPNTSEASRKRKRYEPAAQRSSSPAYKLIPTSSFSSSIDEELTSTPVNPILQNVEDDGSGAASPRTVAAGQLSKLSIDESVKSSEEPESKQKASPRAEATAEEEDTGPPLKRVPRGIRSPRPKFQRFSLPKSCSETDKPALTAEDNLWDFDFSSMTWQDSEITGHLMLDSDDDGTGINGIGFKPTPSIARQRAAQRRRQVHDWKTRQETEERERRAERRRMHTGSVASNLSERVGVKKAVRFAV